MQIFKAHVVINGVSLAKRKLKQPVHVPDEFGLLLGQQCADRLGKIVDIDVAGVGAIGQPSRVQIAHLGAVQALHCARQSRFGLCRAA
jgi:hypothetical protein